MSNDLLSGNELKPITTVPLGVRFINYLIDYMILNSIINGLNLIFHWLPDATVFSTALKANDIPVLINYMKINILLSIILQLLYYFPLEYYQNTTFGKLLTQSKVVNIDGTKPSAKTIFIRTLCRLIPFDSFSYLFKNGVGWHDTISKTRVVRK